MGWFTEVMVGFGLTVQETWFDGDTSQSRPSQLRRLSIRFVPVTAAKLGMVVDQELQVEPLSVEKRYSSLHVPVPPVPAMVTIMVKTSSSHTSATFGSFSITGAVGSSTTIQET